MSVGSSHYREYAHKKTSPQRPDAYKLQPVLSNNVIEYTDISIDLAAPKNPLSKAWNKVDSGWIFFDYRL